MKLSATTSAALRGIALVILAISLALIVDTTLPQYHFADAQSLITTLNSSPEPLPNCSPATASAQFEPILYDTTAAKAEYCSGTNTWSALGIAGGGSGTVTVLTSQA